MMLDFPLWLRATHFLNLHFVSLLVRSGLEILSAHPRPRSLDVRIKIGGHVSCLVAASGTSSLTAGSKSATSVGGVDLWVRTWLEPLRESLQLGIVDAVVADPRKDLLPNALQRAALSLARTSGSQSRTRICLRFASSARVNMKCFPSG
jgi:hypothetical protein